MSLINCPQCENQVSDKARKCPHCGLDLTIPFTPQSQPIATLEQKPKTQKTETVQSKPRKTWPAFVAGVGCMAIVMTALWFFVFKDILKTNEIEQRAHIETNGEFGDFPYNTYFTGTIGSTGNMTIDSKGGGSYTYFSNKTSFTRTIKVKSYDKTSGHLLIESYNKSGDYVGLFDGYTSNNNSYSGTFTNYKGATVEFRLHTESSK